MNRFASLVVMMVTLVVYSTNSYDLPPMRLSVSHQVPFNILTRLADGSYLWRGSNANVWNWISKKLRRPIVLVVPTAEELKKYSYNQASLNHVINGEADVDIMGIAVQAEQLEFIDFSYPILMSPFRMIVPAAQEKSRLFAFTRPFQPLVWLSFFISLIASITAKSLITWLYKRWKLNRQIAVGGNNRSFTHYLGNYIMYTTAIITAHGSSDPFKRNGLRILGALWLLVMTVLVYGYTGLLIASLTIPEMTKPIETLEDVVASHDKVVLYINPDGLAGFGKSVMEGQTGIWKALGDQMRRRPDDLYSRPLTEADFSIDRQNYATPNLDVFTAWMITRIYKKEKICRFHQSKPIPFQVCFQHPLLKGAEGNENISNALMVLWETGLIDFWTREAMNARGGEKCLAPPNTKPKLVPIKLVDLTSAFFILGFGIGVSILTFLIELIVAKYKREMSSSSIVIVKIAAAVAEENDLNPQQNTQSMLVEESAEVVEIKQEII